MSETRRRQDGAVVEPGLRHAEPRAVLEGQLEKIRLRVRINDQRWIEAERNNARAIDSDGLSRNLHRDLVFIHAEKAASLAIAVREPDNLRCTWLAPDSVR